MKDKKESFATKLNRLFADRRKPDGTQYTQTEVAEASNGMLNRVYLWRLRKGKAPNPGMREIQFLASFFGVDPSYFFESDETKAASVIENLKRDAMINQIALRSSELDDGGKQTILLMIDSILKSKK
jgi:transcriptional regulator with XRE-family HTH domain